MKKGMNMKYITIILLILSLCGSHLGVMAKNADVTCTYRETVRKDVTQPAHTQHVRHKEATDVDCCTEADATCKERIQKTAKEYCDRTDRIPKGYSYSSAKIICGKGFIGQEEGIEFTAEE